MTEKWQVKIEGKVSQPAVKKMVEKYSMSSFRNRKGYTGYYANISSESADIFVTEAQEIDGVWINTQRCFD